MNEENLQVLTNIIGAVESGGQVYGKRDYARYTPPGKNTTNEVTCTLGWYQAYGHEAHKLISEIYNTDTATFWKIDNTGIEEMLRYDWEGIKWHPTTKQKDTLVALIDSPVGHEVQDRLFSEKMPKLIADCKRDYTDDIKAQMMYCEIRHLGGKGPVDRIFGRTNGKFDLDSIMASLVKDQKSSNKNLVGSQKFWSRHLKCREFIDRYAKEENVMPVIVGSARGDEYGNARGGKAGDQKQTSKDDWKGEVSKQNWYLHSKGWVVIRAKSPEAREKIAQDMEWACENKYIGYDQGENRTLYMVVEKLGWNCSKVTVYCETDCGQLVRVCVLYAGIKCGDFYTANEVEVLEKTGAFEILRSDKYCKSSDYLLRGDILVTKTKGHTVVVLSDGAKAENTVVGPVVKPDMDYSQTAGGIIATKSFQKFLNNNYTQMLKSYCGGPLTVDGAYGSRTRLCALTVWKYMANKYYGGKLTLGNANFFGSCKEVSAKMTDAEVAKHPTLGYLIQGILAGRGFYSANLDGVCGVKTKACIKTFQKARNIKETGSMNADTWYALFN